MKYWIGLIFVFIVFSLPSSVSAAFGGYPRIYNLWGGNSYGADNAYFASHNLYAMYSDGSSQSAKDRADAIHAINPNTIILITADIIPAHDPGKGLDVQPQWWSAQPGTPDYACILRNSTGNILRDETYDAAVNNLTNSYCRDVLVNHFINRWNGSGGHFNGWQVDQAGDSGVSWNLGTNIDANVDGVPDDPAVVDASFTAGMIDIFQRLRTAFPNIVIHANNSPSYYGQWINGRLFEEDIKRYIDNYYTKPWAEILKDFTSWTRNNTVSPNTTGMMNSPTALLITEKYTFQNIWSAIKPEMLAEYSADYDRMRFGLVTAMMADGMYDYDLSGFMYGVNWWYDEYGTRGQISTLGYLGQPTDITTNISQLTTPDQAVNGDFAAGTAPWFVGTSGPNIVSYTVDNGEAHLHVGGADSGWSIFRENYVTVEAEKYYTVSFRAKSNTSRLAGLRVQRAGGAWEYLTEAKQINLYPEWTQYRFPLKATGSGTNGSLMFDIGIKAGDIYLDDIKFQEGVGGVWQRHFDNGTIVLNEGPLPQTVTLDKTYKKLTGNQAPLYFQRIDDDQAVVTGSWANPAASFDQWGLKVHTITAPNTSASLTYTFAIPYAGEYDVLAWVAPSANNSNNVTVSVNGTDVNLDESTGTLGWHSLGKFNFTQSATVVVKPFGTGQVIGDAFKVVSTARYNDGSVINQISLQPKDAIILLNSNGQQPTQTTTVTTTPTLPPHPGDANGDGQVDGIDYVIWLNHYGSQTPNGPSDGDFNRDGTVDGVDYVIWLNQYTG